MSKNILIVGAGITGAYLARTLAEKDYKVKIVDKKNHIAGHIYDYKDESTGCMVQKYGPHIFHTNNDKVWDWARRFTNFIRFELTNIVYFKDLDKELVCSFGTHTAKELLTEQEYVEFLKSIVEEFPGRISATVPELLNSQNEVTRKFANILWENDYKLYTAKQWGLQPDEIDPDVLKRVPVYLSHYERYFTDKYEGIPSLGYTKWVEKILDHKNIELELSYEVVPKIKDHRVLIDNKDYDLIIFTGAIEEIFNYKFGDLQYRSLRFELFEADNNKNAEIGEPCVYVYPHHDYPYTRITHYGLLPIQNHLDKQICAKEYSFLHERGKSDPYYPVNRVEDMKLYNKYKYEVEQLENIIVAGRLGQYKYYNMDKAIEAAMELETEILKRLEKWE